MVLLLLLFAEYLRLLAYELPHVAYLYCNNYRSEP